MKKAMLTCCSLAILAVPAAALADPPAMMNAEIEQTGSNSRANVTQQNAGPEVYGHIYQNGSAHTGIIHQVGPAEDAIVAQLTQGGNGNFGSLSQSAVEASAVAEMQQHGSFNVGYIQQTGVRNVSATIDQTGEVNWASIYQARDHGDTRITQNGYGNLADVAQIGGFYLDSVEVYQHGNENSINVLQEGENGATIVSEQIGSNNVADVYQTIDSPPSELMADLYTQGDDNVIFVEQDAWLSEFNLVQVGHMNQVDVYQVGEGAHTTIVSTESNYNTDTISQYALSNNIIVDRHHSHNNSTSIAQIGAYLSARVEQWYSESAIASIIQDNPLEAEALVIQQYVGNAQASIVQSFVSDSSAGIQQVGVASTSAQISQGQSDASGTSLIASVYQADGADFSHAQIDQLGQSNEAHIGQINAISSDASIFQNGVNSYAEILQGSGSYNTATINQGGEGYSASIHQGGSNNYTAITQM